MLLSTIRFPPLLTSLFYPAASQPPTCTSCLLLFHSCSRPSTRLFSTTATLNPFCCSASATQIPNVPPHITTSKSGLCWLLLLLLLELLVAAAAGSGVAAGAAPKLSGLLLLLLLLGVLVELVVPATAVVPARMVLMVLLLVVMTVGPFLWGSCCCCLIACKRMTSGVWSWKVNSMQWMDMG